MTFIAVLLPWLSFLLRKKWLNALMAFVFQSLAIYSLFPTGIGVVIWLIVASWAVLAYNNEKSKKQSSSKKDTAS